MALPGAGCRRTTPRHSCALDQGTNLASTHTLVEEAGVHPTFRLITGRGVRGARSPRNSSSGGAGAPAGGHPRYLRSPEDTGPERIESGCCQHSRAAGSWGACAARPRYRLLMGIAGGPRMGAIGTGAKQEAWDGSGLDRQSSGAVGTT